MIVSRGATKGLSTVIFFFSPPQKGLYDEALGSFFRNVDSR